MPTWTPQQRRVVSPRTAARMPARLPAGKSATAPGKPELKLFDGVIAPPELHIPSGSRIFMDVYNSLASLSVRATYRYLTRGGKIKQGSLTVNPTTDRVLSSQSDDLSDCYLLSMAVEPVGASPVRGQTWVRVGFSVNGLSEQILFADYLVKGSALAYPGSRVTQPLEGRGYLSTFLGTDPAAGVAIDETVPVRRAWRLLGMEYTLVADATVINRRMGVAYTDGTNFIFRTKNTNSIAASQTGIFSAALKGAEVNNLVDFACFHALPDIILFPGYHIQSYITNLQAGDNLGAPTLCVEEWIVP